MHASLLEMLQKLFISLLFFFVCWVIWLKILLYSGNTLYRHPLWTGAKRQLQMTTVGANEFVLSRPALARNRIHLGTWWGLHGLNYRPEVEPTKVTARVRLLDGAYIYMTFGDRDQAVGLRLSHSPRWDSAAVVLRNNEEILSEKKISTPLSEKVHAVTIQLDGSKARLFLDGSKVDEVENTPHKGQLFFRGSFKDAEILSVDITGRDGPILEESFSNTYLWRPMALLTIGVLAVFCVLLQVFSSQKFLTVLTGLLTVGLIGLSYLFFDYFGWSSVQQSASTRALRLETHLPLSMFEKYRFQAAEKLYELFGAPPLSLDGLASEGYAPVQYDRGPFFCLGDKPCEYVPDLDKARELTKATHRGPRMLFVGTSQLAGAGANSLSDTIFARTHRYMQTHWSPHLESLNISVSGGRTKEIQKSYRDSLSAFRPDLVVFDLAFNDMPEELESSLPEFIEMLRDEGARVVMIKEPTNNEVGYPNEDRQKNAQAIAERLNVPFLLLHDYMNDPETIRKGLLWWDMVHMTSFGQALAAAWLDPQLLKFIGPKLSSR